MNATENDSLLANLRRQSELLTHAEVIHLLAHDLGHMAIHVTEAVESLVLTATKTLQEQRATTTFEIAAQKARQACLELEQVISKIRIVRRLDEVPARFSLSECVCEVVDVMSHVLDRMRMSVRLSVPDSLTCYGPRTILKQVIFTLMINSVDAQRSRRYIRNNVIHISAKKNDAPTKCIVITLGDEGPGINRLKFPNPKEIFEIGTTGKVNGTGLGLPVVRYILNHYFSGSIQLIDSTKALFEISIFDESDSEYDS